MYLVYFADSRLERGSSLFLTFPTALPSKSCERESIKIRNTAQCRATSRALELLKAISIDRSSMIPRKIESRRVTREGRIS